MGSDRGDFVGKRQMGKDERQTSTHHVSNVGKIQDEGSNRTNNTDISIRGGDTAACLSSVDIDSVLRAAGVLTVEAALFFRLRQGLVDVDHVRREINAALAHVDEVFFVAHFRHHWVALRFFIRPSFEPRQQHKAVDHAFHSSDTRGIEVFDSAPSPMVSRDICRLCVDLAWPVPVFVPSPRQTRGSNECGLFALAAVLLLRTGCSLPLGTFTLCPLRSILPDCVSPESPTRTQAIARFISTAKAIYGIAPDTHHCDTCGVAVPIPAASLRANIINTHLQSEYHLHTVTASARLGAVPCAGNDDTAQRCTAITQAKHGARQCSSLALTGQATCQLHFLLSRAGSEPCTATSKAGRPCSHRAISALGTCPFHVDEVRLAAWLAKGAPAEDHPQVNEAHQQQHPPRVPSPVTEDAHAPPPPLAQNIDEILALVDDPDFEAELAALLEPGAAAPRPVDQPLPQQPVHQQTLSVDVTGTLGSAMVILRRATPSMAHPLALSAWKRATWLEHRRALLNLQNDKVTHLLAHLPLVRGILEVLNRRRRARRWKWASMLRNMAILQGAFKQLPLSTNVQQVDLSLSPEWCASLRYVASEAKSERPRVPLSATAAQVTAAILAEPLRKVRLLLALTWVCCGRTGDLTQLSPADFEWASGAAGARAVGLTVTFRRGKTVERRGPYSLHTSLPGDWLEPLGLTSGDTASLDLAIAEMRRTEVKDVLAALRRVSPDLENRSLRRGALQVLAMSGVDEATLLLFSGHTQVSTLRRYLAWGAIGSEKMTRMLGAATALHPVQPPGPDALHGGGDSVLFDIRQSPLLVDPVSPTSPPQTQFPTRRHDPYLSGLITPPPTYETFLRSHAPSFSSSVNDTVCFGGGSPHNRWLEFLGSECPPVEELPGFYLQQQVPDADLPMSSKAVLASADIDALLALAVDPELRSLARDSFRWLYDSTLYEPLLQTPNKRRRMANCKLSPEDWATQIRLGKYALPRLTRSHIRAWCRIFTVPERSKGRRRHICEPLLNDGFSHTPTIRFATKDARHHIYGKMKGGFGVCLDYASCFDQYGLHSSVQQFFGIQLPDGGVSAMNVLPMGFRPSAAIAQAGTWCVCDVQHLFPHLRSGVDYVVLSYIDNILVMGRTHDITTAVTRVIIERSTAVGLRLNEHHPPLATSWTPEPSQIFDFLGEQVNLADGTVCQSAKSLNKVALVDLRPDSPMTKRQLAAVIGLFIFASSCCATVHNRHLFYYALRFYRQQVQWSNGSQPRWDDNISPMPQAVRQNFLDWQRELLHNRPLELSPEVQQMIPTDLLFVDASAERWAAVHIPASGGLRVFYDDWTDSDQRDWDLHSSVCSEPLGIRRALCRAIAPTPDSRVVVYTDHAGVVDAVSAPCANCYAYWRLQCFLAGFPARVVLRHIAGVKNPADVFTRGPVEPSRELDPAWQKMVADARDWHEQVAANTNTSRRNGADGGAEWLQTARNPYRALHVG